MNNITKIAKMVSEFVTTKLDKETTLTTIEQTTRSVIQEIGRQAIEMSVNSMNSPYPERVVTCSCGKEAAYVRQREARLYTIFGKLQVRRAYYLCKGHQGIFPLDNQLGLRPNELSAELRRLVGITGIQLPYGTGRNLFEELTLVSVSDQTMAKATRSIGKIVEGEEALLQKKAQEAFYLRQRKREARRPIRLYGAIDATKVHIRDDTEHRWRDLKLGAWFEAGGKPPTSPDGEWTIQAKNIRYYADICPANEFGGLFWSSGVARDAQLALELVMLGDGADWIWNLVAAYFPKAIQILDWFHASEHLMPVALVAFASEEQRTSWVTDMKQLMWDGKVEELITACDELAIECTNDIIRKTANYFENHKERMQYAYFRKQGYQIGSGTIESAAKQIGMMRMKVPGAIWNEESARLVAKARAAYLSDQWHSLPLAV